MKTYKAVLAEELMNNFGDAISDIYDYVDSSRKFINLEFLKDFHEEMDNESYAAESGWRHEVNAEILKLIEFLLKEGIEIVVL
jgi:hypothetical protein